LSRYKSEVYATEFSGVRILQLRGLIWIRRIKNATLYKCGFIFMWYDAVVPIIYWIFFSLAIDLQLSQVFCWLPVVYFAVANESPFSAYLL